MHSFLSRVPLGRYVLAHQTRFGWCGPLAGLGAGDSHEEAQAHLGNGEGDDDAPCEQADLEDRLKSNCVRLTAMKWESMTGTNALNILHRRVPVQPAIVSTPDGMAAIQAVVGQCRAPGHDSTKGREFRL